jgi:hypothetical protein
VVDRTNRHYTRSRPDNRSSNTVSRKKISIIWVRAGENTHASDSKSFLLLFFKKEALPSLSPHER